MNYPFPVHLSGKLPPGQMHPSSLPPVPSIYRPGPVQFDVHTSKNELLNNFKPHLNNRPAPYLPQPEDYLHSSSNGRMGPLGAWATGRPDYSYLAGLTGVRPVVDRYSVTRFSEGEWRKRNQDMLSKSHHEQNRSNAMEWNAMKAMDDVRIETDKNQADNTRRLRFREMEIYRWRAELDAAALAMGEEIQFLEEQKQRLKKSLMIVLMPNSIAGECLDRRTGRLDIELVRDDVEDELTRELSLTSEIRLQLEQTLRAIENQQVENRNAKQRLEYDWSDKQQSHELASINYSLHNSSSAILFKPGAVTFQSEQSTVELWNEFVRNIIEEADAVRYKSEKLRATLDAILMNSARDLRTQSDKVELALAKRIATTEGIKQQLDIEMKKIMQKLVDTENLMPVIKQSIQRLDMPLKTAQTRLDNKTYRLRVENCRDPPQYGLIEEVKMINESVAQLKSRLKHVEESHDALMLVRSDLEREILLKRKTLEIDRDILRDVRSHYPSANALSGYVE